MNIQETITKLQSEVVSLQSEVTSLQERLKATEDIKEAGNLYCVQTENGGCERHFANLNEAIEYYTVLRERFSSVEIELHKTKSLYNDSNWEQF